MDCAGGCLKGVEDGEGDGVITLGFWGNGMNEQIHCLVLYL